MSIERRDKVSSLIKQLTGIREHLAAIYGQLGQELDNRQLIKAAEACDIAGDMVFRVANCLGVSLGKPFIDPVTGLDDKPEDEAPKDEPWEDEPERP